MGSRRLRPFIVEAVIDFGATRTGHLFLRRANDPAEDSYAAQIVRYFFRFRPQRAFQCVSAVVNGYLHAGNVAPLVIKYFRAALADCRSPALRITCLCIVTLFFGRFGLAPKVR
jgi:hypothetical protein